MIEDNRARELLASCYLLLEEYNVAEKIHSLRRFGKVWADLRDLGIQKEARGILEEEERHPPKGLVCPRCSCLIAAGAEAHARVAGVPVLACPEDGCLLMQSAGVLDYVPEAEDLESAPR